MGEKSLLIVKEEGKKRSGEKVPRAGGRKNAGKGEQKKKRLVFPRILQG